MEDCKNQLQIKDKMLQQLTETLQDKDKQMQDFFSLMKPGLAGVSQNLLNCIFFSHLLFMLLLSLISI